MSRRTKDRVVIVTGASAGIGRALARICGRAGYRVVAVARRKERLENLARDIAQRGGACEIVVADVRDAAAPKVIVSAALARFGRIDVLVNNAGMGAVGGLLEQTDAQLDAQWQTHVAAPLRITREALPALRATHGQVLFMGSGFARVPGPGYGAYSAVKAAIRAAARQLRSELRDDGIAVTYVDPGLVDTEFMQAAGRESAHGPLAVSALRVAKRMLRAFRTRPSRLNAVPWQTAAVVVGEFLPKLADLVMNNLLDKPVARIDPTPIPQPGPEPMPGADPMPAEPEPQIDPAAPQDVPSMPATTFDAALAPVARRMERVKLPRDFVRDLLVPGDELQLGDVAMRWAGMPNKNERAAVGEVLDALTPQFLGKTGAETWRVLRAPE